MIAAIMQPYFFPYIGYFQLMSAVDVFVFFDDAQYVTRGWVNRNLIYTNNAPHWLTMPVEKANRFLPINKRRYQADDAHVLSLERRLQHAYRGFPGYDEAMPALSHLLHFPDTNVAHFNSNLLTSLAKRLNIGCDFLFSSKIGNFRGLRGEAKVIRLCHALGCTHYINPIGGLKLYNSQHFLDNNILLSFLQTRAQPMTLATGTQHLSIIDHLMRYGVAQCLSSLGDYDLIAGSPDNSSSPGSF